MSHNFILFIISLGLGRFSKESDGSRLANQCMNMFLSNLALKDITAKYESSLEGGNKISYPWLFMFVHLIGSIELFNTMKFYEKEKISLGFIEINIIIFILNCYRLHNRYIEYSRKYEERRK